MALATRVPFPVNATCSAMNQLPDLEALAEVLNIAYNMTQKPIQCFNNQNPMAPSFAKSWFYQSCTQFYFPQNTNNVTDFFFPLIVSPDAYDRYCQQVIIFLLFVNF